MVTGTTTTTTRYYYDDQRIVLQTSVSGQTETDDRYFAYGNYIDEVLLMHTLAGTNTGDYYYGHDHLYSPAVLFDAAGTPVERYEYDVYGKVRIYSPNYELRTTSSFGNPYTFTGRELDALDCTPSAVGCTLYYYRARTYDPATGRFLQRDPIGIDPAGNDESNPFWSDRQYSDGMDLYQYCYSQPVINLDPTGLGLGSFIGCYSSCLEDNDPIDMALGAAIAGLVAGPIPKTTVAAIARALGNDELADQILKSLKSYPTISKVTTLPSALSAKLRHGGRSTLRMLGRTASKYAGPALVAYGLALAAVEVHCAGVCGACEYYELEYDPETMNIMESLRQYFE